MIGVAVVVCDLQRPLQCQRRGAEEPSAVLSARAEFYVWMVVEGTGGGRRLPHAHLRKLPEQHESPVCSKYEEGKTRETLFAPPPLLRDPITPVYKREIKTRSPCPTVSPAETPHVAQSSSWSSSSSVSPAPPPDQARREPTVQALLQTVCGRAPFQHGIGARPPPVNARPETQSMVSEHIHTHIHARTPHHTLTCSRHRTHISARERVCVLGSARDTSLSRVSKLPDGGVRTTRGRRIGRRTQATRKTHQSAVAVVSGRPLPAEGRERESQRMARSSQLQGIGHVQQGVPKLT